MPTKQIAKKLLQEPWAITPEWLQKMVAIADRHSDIDALEAKLGKELSYSHNMTIRGATAIIPVDGPIFAKAGIFARISGATSLEMIAQDIQTANDTPEVKNIVLHINSPGGNVVGIDEAHALIAASEKDIYSHITGIGASAAYWLASATKKISLSPASQIGGIGVIYSMDRSGDSSDTLEIVSSASPRKNLDPATDEGRIAVLATIDKIAEVFISQVATGRNVSTDVVKQKFGKGDMLTGDDAVAVGMADTVGTFEELIAKLATEQKNKFGEGNMNATELKEKHPETYQAVLAEGGKSVTSEMQASQAALEKEKEDLSAKISALEAKLSEKDANSSEIAARLKELEKKEAIRQVADAQLKLDGQVKAITEGALLASDIPESLREKVAAAVSPDKFMVEGKLDAEGFKAAVDAEIEDWSGRLHASSTAISGFGIPPVEPGNASAASDKDADRILSYISTAN